MCNIFKNFSNFYRPESSRNPGESSSNNNSSQTDEPVRGESSRRPSRRLYDAPEWFRPENPNQTQFGESSTSSSSASTSNPTAAFVEQDESVVRQQPISPDLLIYDIQPSSNDDSNNIRDASQASDSVPFSSQNPSNVQQRIHTAPRCPFYRRSSLSSYHSMPNHYQNGNGYLRPAYAPHESLWYRQQNNQEVHRRHMMNSMGTASGTNESSSSSSFGSYPSRVGVGQSIPNGYCLQCDQQHPVGHPHRRIRYVCGLNLVSEIEQYIL